MQLPKKTEESANHVARLFRLLIHQLGKRFQVEPILTLLATLDLQSIPWASLALWCWAYLYMFHDVLRVVREIWNNHAFNYKVTPSET